MDGPVAGRKGIRLISGSTIIVPGHVNFLDGYAGSGLSLGLGIGVRIGPGIGVAELTKAACQHDKN